MTNKKERHRNDSALLLEAYMADGGLQELEDYIQRHSNLPGPRGNLELAHGFADAVAAAAGPGSGKLWGLLCALASVPAVEAPVNSPGELIPFCGTLGMGALAAEDENFRAAALGKLRSLANDPRWRTREAVAQGLQRLAAVSPEETAALLESLS